MTLNVNQNADAVIAAINSGDHDGAALTAALEAESADKKRQTVISAINAALQAIADAESIEPPEDAPQSEPEPPAQKALASQPTISWRRDDYSGPLTLDQALWRKTNIKLK